MNIAPNQQAATLRRSRGVGLILYVSTITLAIATIAGIVSWSNNPRPLSIAFGWEDGGNNPGSALGGGDTGGVPRSRGGLVATADNRGQILFGRYCDSCHTSGRNMIGPSVRTRAFKNEYNTPDKIINLVRKGGFDMPAFPTYVLSDDDLREITQYVLSLPEENP
jgi:cytochrome c551/c552